MNFIPIILQDQKLAFCNFDFCIRFGLIFDFWNTVRKIALFLNPNN